MTERLELIPLLGFPLVEPGDDLAQLIFDALRANDLSLCDGDVLVVAQKIVSKAENRYVRLADVSVSAEARALAEQADKDPRQVQLILQESRAVLRVRPGVIIVEHRNGYVHANAGIDKSNILRAADDPRVLLLDLQYHDVKRTRGLYYLMESRGLIERVVEEESVQRAMSTPPQTTRAKVRGDFIRFARAKNRSYTVDWTYLKLNGYWEETILCMDPFSPVNRRVEELLSQMSGGRFYR